MWLHKFRYHQLFMIVLMAVLITGCPLPVLPLPGGQGGTPFPTSGLNVTIESVTISLDRRPEVVFTMTDNGDIRIPLNQLGSSDVRFALAALESTTKSANSPQFVNYTYKFATILPQNYTKRLSIALAVRFAGSPLSMGSGIPPTQSLNSNLMVERSPRRARSPRLQPVTNVIPDWHCTADPRDSWFFWFARGE